MKSYGIELHTNTVIKNTNIDYGDTFPQVGTETPGQLFFKQDENSIYVRNADNTKWMNSSGGMELIFYQNNHGYTSTDIGMPIYLDSLIWAPAIADEVTGTSQQGVLAGIVDEHNIIVQSGGLVTDIHASVNQDGGVLVPNSVYYLSTVTPGKVTSTKPPKDKLASPVYVSVSSTSALVLYSPEFPINVNDLANVSANAPSDKQVLGWDGATSTWKPMTVSAEGGAISLDELTDVAITTPLNGDVIVYNSVSGNWENSASGAGFKSIMTDNVSVNGTFSHDDGSGNVVTISLNSDDLPFYDVNGYVSSDNVHGAILEVRSLAEGYPGAKSVFTDNLATNGTISHDDGTTLITTVNLNSENLPFVTALGGNGPSSNNVRDAIDEAYNAGGGGSVVSQWTVTQNSHGFTTGGTPIRYIDETSQWVAAQADDPENVHIAVVAYVVDGNIFVAQQSGYMDTIGVEVLVPGLFYYLSKTTPGGITSIRPVEGEVDAPVLQALTASSAIILPYRASVTAPEEIPTSPWVLINDDYVAVHGQKIIVDASSQDVIIDLPIDNVDGDQVITRLGKTKGGSPDTGLMVDPGPHTVNGEIGISDVADILNRDVIFVYFDIYGWSASSGDVFGGGF